MMNAKTRVPIRNRLLVACGILALFAFGSSASAETVRIHFSGAPGSGYTDLTLGPAAADDSMFDPDRPPKAITGATGSFNGVAITGVRPLNHATPPDGETLPASYSLLDIAGFGDHNGVSYNNLFYPLGSPLICYPDGELAWPFAGGMLDLMGVMLALDNGNFVDLWSFGVMEPDGLFPGSPGGGLRYGMRLIESVGDGAYQVWNDPTAHPFAFATVSVPEPDLFWMFGAAFLGLLAWRRSAETRKQAGQAA